ncbi:DNA_polymerase [Hexamita inflata]|uniref:DNA-directed DNA polymerase n=1 Tax=Hexamita inflata TaxID=28002 RepID=A0AA86NN58_9EUKA|nr:DNA polymerase [Hexamita inflata]
MGIKNIINRNNRNNQGQRTVKTIKIVRKVKPTQPKIKSNTKTNHKPSKARISLQKTTIDMYLRHIPYISLEQLNTLLQQKITKKQKQQVKDQITKIEEKQLTRQQMQEKIEQQKLKIKTYTPTQIKEYMQVHQIYNTSFELSFFQEFTIEILEHYINNYIKITFLNQDTGREEHKIFLITKDTIIDLMELIHKGKNYEDMLTGSDREILQTYYQATKVEIITPNEFKSSQYKKRKGAYFNYINITEVDLERYQIGNNEQEHLQLSKTQCFIHSLRQSGEYSESLIEYIQSQMNEDNIQFSFLSIKKLNGLGPIHLTYYEDGKNDRVYDINTINYKETKTETETPKLVNIGCYKNHYFINDKSVPISKVWIKNYKEHHNSPTFMKSTNLKQIRKTTKSYCYSFYTDDQNIGISAGTMITTMMEQGLFQEIENPNIYNQNEDKPISAPIDCKPFQKISLTKEEKDLQQKEWEDKQQKRLLDQYNEGIKGIEGIEQEEIEQEKLEETEEQEETEETEEIEKREIRQLIIYADFESTTKDENNNNIVHKPFLLCWTVNGDEFYHGRTIFSLIEFIQDKAVQESYNKFLVLYHNLSYDASFILQQQIKISSILKPDNQIIQFTVQIKHHLSIVFRDSMRLTGNDVSVSKMPAMFFTKEMQSKIYKEIFPYTYYTMNRYLIKFGSIEEASKHIGKHTKEEFIFSIQNAQAYVDEDTFDLQQYALYYCEQDVRVLSKSMQIFEQMIKEHFNLDLFKYVSISSLSLESQKQSGCFKGCVQVTGQLRKFLQQFVIGGRVMTANNKIIKVGKEFPIDLENKQVVVINKDDTTDDDCTSMYPSAQRRMYYPAGECKTLTKEQIQYYNNPNNLFKITLDEKSKDKSTLYLEVKLKKSKSFIKRDFPLISYKNKDGVRMFTNDFDTERSYFYDHISLQDLITFQHVEYEIVSGVRFTSRNYNIQNIIYEMFTKRQEFKKQGNPVQIIYKLMLNSSYGKTIEAVHNTEDVIVTEKKYVDYIYKNKDFIKEITQIGDKYIVNVRSEVVDQTAYTYIGVLILSVSKRIMNEVMCTAEDTGIKIYYQDTDSIQISKADVPILNDAFFKKYGRERQGKGMGQFHEDYESKKGEVTHASRAIYLGKKFYAVELQVETKKGEQDIDYHLRGKGVTTQSILKKCQDYNCDPIELYNKLSNHEEIEFDLCTDKPCFEKNKAYEYVSRESFIRKVKF